MRLFAAPILISFLALAAAQLALNNPEAYGRLMEHASPAISTFGGAVLFVYRNILDSAFSLDGVVGAFALTTAIGRYLA